MGDENTNTNSLTISSGDDIAEELKALEDLKKKIPSEHGGIFTIAPAPQSPVTQINAPDIEEERRLLEEAKKGSPEIGSAPPVTLADTLKHVGYGNVSDEIANLAREEQNPDVINEFPQWFEKSPDQIGYLYQRRKNEAMGDVANKAIESAITSTPSMIGNFVKGGIQVLGDATGIQLDELKHENDLTDDEKLTRAVKSFYNPMQDVLEGGWRNLQRAKDHGTFVTDQYKIANGQMTEKEAEQQFRDREAINTHNAQFDATKPDSVARAIDYTRPLTQKAVRAMIAMQTASVDAIMAEHPEWTRDQAVNFKIDHDNLQSEQLIQNAIKEQNKTLPSDEQTSFGSLVNPLGNEFGWVNMGTHLAMNGAEATGKLLRFGGDLDKTGTMGEKGYQFAEGVASDAEKDVATPGRVQQAAESLANTIQKTGESVDVALNKLPEPIRTAVKAKLPSILTGAGLVGAGAVGAIEDPNNAVAGALKGLTLGSAVFAPRVLSDLLKADAKVAGGTGSMFKTAYDSPESALATKLFSYVPSRTIPVVNKVASQFIADKAKNFIRDGVHATTIATALGLASDKDAEQIGADVANGMLFIGGHGAIGSILGKDPRQQIRDKRRQDYQNYQFLSGLDPADKEIVNDVSGWNNVVNHSQQKYDDAIKNYAEAYNNDPNSEDTKNLSKQVVRAKADLADKKGANFSTREAYKREILSILAEEERKVNGSLLPGGNVKFRFMTRDQIADQLQRGNNNMDRATALHYADNAGARYAANGQGVQPLVFDPMRDSVVLNMDKMRQVQADTGKTMAWVLRHEIAEQLMHTKQGQELFQPLSDSLFGKQILKPDGSYMMDGKGVYTPEMLNEQFINNYLGKKTPQEKVVWAKNNGLWDYQNDDFDKPKVAQYMQKEVLAEANAAGLMDTEARLDSPLENLRAWAVVNGENSRLARITQAIVGRGSRNPLKSDLTGVTYTPEHFSQVRNANIQLQKLNGAIDATEQAPAPKVTPKDMMNNRSLAEGLGKDDGVFKTTKVLEILDDKGNVVATQLVDPKTYEGEWAHDPADNKNVKVAGYGSTPDFINNQIIPQGGKARISSQIVYDKEGKPAINTPAEFKAHQKIRTDAIRNIFDTIDSGINGAMTRGRTGEYNYRGSITDNQFKALMSLPEDIMSYSEKKKLALVRDVINDPSGSTMIGLHSARLNARGRYQAFTPKIREERPFSIQFSKDGHFLPVTFNVTGARDKVKYIMKYQPSLLTLWGNDPNKFMEGLSQYMTNWQNDPVIKDASGKDIPIDPLSEQAARIRHENLDEDPQVALQKRYIYDAFMNTQPPKDAVGRANFNPVTIELPKVKRKDKTKEEKDDFQRSDPNTLIRSPRLDGYHDIARGNGIKFPFQYGKSIYNAMPDAQVPFADEPTKPTSEPQQPAAPQPSSDILKGIQAVHNPVNAGFGAAFVPSERSQTMGSPMAVNKANNPVGINISDKEQDFTGQILRGEKTIETRDNPTSLAPYVGKRVGLISTGNGKAKLVGTAVVGEPKVYNSKEEFRADQDKHLVEPGSTFDIKTGGKKWGFPITDVQYLEPSEVTKNGIVSREITLPSSTPSAEQTKFKPITKGISEPSDEHDEFRVGTSKLGTEKKPIDTPQTSNIGRDVVPDDIFKRQMKKIDYAHLPDSVLKQKNPEKKRRAFIDWMKGNLRALHDAYSEDVRARATHWYDGARKIAEMFASDHQIEPHQAAGVLAVLSPQKDWFMNVAQAGQVMDIWKNHQDTKITTEKYGNEIQQIIEVAQAPAKQKIKTDGMKGDELEKARQYNNQLDVDAKQKRAALLNSLFGKTIKELDASPEEQAWAIRVLAQVEHGRNYHNLSPEGETLDLARNKSKKDGEQGDFSKNGWGTTGEIMKAVEILKNGDLKNISEQLGNEHKVRNFYNNIIAPNSPYGDATIDTHAVAAAHLMPYGASAIPVNHNFGSGMSSSDKHGVSGGYHLYLDAYKELAKELGLQPRQLQSITWEAIRSLFPSEQRSSKAVNDTTSIWRNNNDETARNTIIGRGIPNPVWHRPNNAQ